MTESNRTLQRRHHRACPGDPRPGFVTARKTWMAGTSARSKASSPSPAMTTADSRVNCLTDTPPRSRRMRASFAARFARLKHQRAQGMPGARCARSLACKIKKHTSIVTTVTPGSPGIPRAMVLTVSFVLFPVTGLVCHRRQRKYFRQLDASVGASEPHDFAVRLTCCSSKAPSASTASRPAFVTIAIRPSSGVGQRCI
jgi:hypothetical protein